MLSYSTVLRLNLEAGERLRDRLRSLFLDLRWSLSLVSPRFDKFDSWRLRMASLPHSNIAILSVSYPKCNPNIWVTSLIRARRALLIVFSECSQSYFCTLSCNLGKERLFLTKACELCSRFAQRSTASYHVFFQRAGFALCVAFREHRCRFSGTR